MSYEVLYNCCYGGFGFPQEFLREVFRRFPPESEEGKRLWRPTHDRFLQPEDSVPTDTFSHRIVKTEDFCHGYKWLYYEEIGTYTHDKRYVEKHSDYCTKDFVTYYHVSYNYASEWRTLPAIVAMVREYKVGNLRIAKVPAKYGFHIRDYDGMETVHVSCPNETLVADLVRIIREGNREGIHALTQALLDGVAVSEVLCPKVEIEE